MKNKRSITNKPYDESSTRFCLNNWWTSYALKTKTSNTKCRSHNIYIGVCSKWTLLTILIKFLQKMKVLGFLLILMSVGACLASPRKARLRGNHGEEQWYRIERGQTMQGNNRKVKTNGDVLHQERYISNHHAIPRQHYNDKSGSSSSSSSQGNDPDNNGDRGETGQP